MVFSFAPKKDTPGGSGGFSVPSSLFFSVHRHKIKRGFSVIRGSGTGIDRKTDAAGIFLRRPPSEAFSAERRKTFIRFSRRKKLSAADTEGRKKQIEDSDHRISMVFPCSHFSGPAAEAAWKALRTAAYAGHSPPFPRRPAVSLPGSPSAAPASRLYTEDSGSAFSARTRRPG